VSVREWELQMVFLGRVMQFLAIPMRRNISASLPPSYDISDPRYTKSLIKSTFSAVTWSVDWFGLCSPVCLIFVFDQLT